MVVLKNCWLVIAWRELLSEAEIIRWVCWKQSSTLLSAGSSFDRGCPGRKQLPPSTPFAVPAPLWKRDAILFPSSVWTKLKFSEGSLWENSPYNIACKALQMWLPWPLWRPCLLLFLPKFTPFQAQIPPWYSWHTPGRSLLASVRFSSYRKHKAPSNWVIRRA